MGQTKLSGTSTHLQKRIVLKKDVRVENIHCAIKYTTVVTSFICRSFLGGSVVFSVVLQALKGSHEISDVLANPIPSAMQIVKW